MPKKPEAFHSTLTRKKRLLAAIFVSLAILALMHLPTVIRMGGIRQATSLEQTVSFLFSQAPKCTYSLDRFTEGRDYDKLMIFTISSNIPEFEAYVRQSGWEPLPLADDIRSHPLCKDSFDGNMQAMLRCGNGYYRWKGKSKELVVYDAEQQLVYIRKASVIH